MNPVKSSDMRRVSVVRIRQSIRINASDASAKSPCLATSTRPCTQADVVADSVFWKVCERVVQQVQYRENISPQHHCEATYQLWSFYAMPKQADLDG